MFAFVVALQQKLSHRNRADEILERETVHGLESFLPSFFFFVVSSLSLSLSLQTVPVAMVQQETSSPAFIEISSDDFQFSFFFRSGVDVEVNNLKGGTAICSI